jgi:hypothetical protein
MDFRRQVFPKESVMQTASASHPQKARRRRYFGLQARFIVSYLFAVLLPILLMSIFLYRYHTDQMDSNYQLEKQNSLAIEQLAAENLNSIDPGIYH